MATFILAGVFRADDDPAAREAILAAGVDPAGIGEAIRLGQVVDPAPAADRFLNLFATLRLADAWEAANSFQTAVRDLAAVAVTVTAWPDVPICISTTWGAPMDRFDRR